MQPMIFVSPWLWITLILMMVDWVATGYKARKLRRLTKPLALMALIVLFSLAGGWRGALLWFGLGLVFSLLGDIFLLQPNQTFLLGLVAFLIGHLCYIIGFNASPLVWNPLMLPIVAVVAFVAFLVGRYILRGLRRGDSYSRLRVPVLAYMTIIAVMLLSALACFFRPDWPVQAAALSATGAVSFLTSDSILASDRFVRQRRWAAVALIITYHLGQVLIVCGALTALA
jgi:uncharacterized membrane protein YhhN